MASASDLNQIALEYADFVKKMAHHLSYKLPKTIQIDDLIQSGMMGLLEAAKNYDFDKGASFQTYASIRVRGAMLDEVRRLDWAPRSVHRNSKKINQAIQILENRLGREAKDQEIAEYLGLDLSTYHQMLKDKTGTQLFAFDELVANQEEWQALLEQNTIPGPLETLQRGDFQKIISTVMADLPEKERLVLSLYYDEDLNLREVGQILGVSESRISQIHSQAMSRIQKRLAANR